VFSSSPVSISTSLWRLLVAGLLVLLTGIPVNPQGRADQKTRLDGIRNETARLKQELETLKPQERGVLGEVERLGAELRLRSSEMESVELELDQLRVNMSSLSDKLAELDEFQEERKRYLAFRIRELYRNGPDEAIRRLLGGDEVEQFWNGLRYTSLLSTQDSRMLAEYRRTAAQISRDRQQLVDKEAELEDLRAAREQARSRLASSRRSHQRKLASLREDQGLRVTAIKELDSAAAALSTLVDSLGPQDPLPELEIKKFQGLLEWPADGRVSADFGSKVHPRFKTSVPHTGLDIDSPAGADIRAVFDGEVVFSAWIRGYGLTAIIDHGDGLLSISSHASVLIVEPGEWIRRGQLVGKVGDTGSLRGPYLYFELRLNGISVDPRDWLQKHDL
jgi:septal ring factor EnvC (AmiA/AmiB activator)